MSLAISVVVTCYNLERYIGEAIRSVLAQDYAGEIEIIVVDDHSTDSSADVIRQFPEVRYIRTPSNSGVLLSTVAGMEAASHDVVAFLDGDDLWTPEKLRLVAQAFEHNPKLAFITHDIRCIDAEGAELAIPSRPAQKMPLIPPREVSERLKRGVLLMDDFICLGSAVTVRRSAGNLAGFADFVRTIPDPVNTYQDWTMVSWCAVQPGAEFDYIPSALYRYRLHEANHSGDARTLARAQRNLRRTLNTIDAMLAIEESAGVEPDIIRSLRQRRRVIRYLLDLNGGRRGAAIQGFLQRNPVLRNRRLLMKEAARFIGVQLLGPERFVELAGSRSVMKNLPAT
jgi:glycosyltransferase involved in cell wall biosynthesis